MHRRLLFIAITLFAFLPAAIPALSQNGGRFAGVFVLRTDFGSGQVGTAFLALHNDGSVTQTFTNPLYSPIHGVWEKTGPATALITEYTFITYPTGFWGIGRSQIELRFSPDANSYTGTMFLEGVPCASAQACPDPASPETVWTAAPTPPSTVSGTRLEVLPFGPLPLTEVNHARRILRSSAAAGRRSAARPRSACTVERAIGGHAPQQRDRASRVRHRYRPTHMNLREARRPYVVGSPAGFERRKYLQRFTGATALRESHGNAGQHPADAVSAAAEPFPGRFPTRQGVFDPALKT